MVDAQHDVGVRECLWTARKDSDTLRCDIGNRGTQGWELQLFYNDVLAVDAWLPSHTLAIDEAWRICEHYQVVGWAVSVSPQVAKTPVEQDEH